MAVASHYDFNIDTPWNELPEKIRKVLLFGSGNEAISFNILNEKGGYRSIKQSFEGIVNNLERRYYETESIHVKEELTKYQNNKECPSCNGSRLRMEAQCVTVGKYNIAEISRWQLRKCFSSPISLNAFSP